MSNNIWLRLGITVLCWDLVRGIDACNSSDFSSHGDYILGGLFGIHGTDSTIDTLHRLPEALQCSTLTFLPAGYQQLQVFRFTIEEINNSTDLLPGVILGYEIFDYCTDSLNFRAALDFLSSKGVVPFINIPRKVISVTGPFGSQKTLTVAPLFMANLMPMVNHGASSVELSNKYLYPSFFRTIPSDYYQVRAIVRILQYFNWNWIAFFGSDNAYSQDALTVFMDELKTANICLAFNGILSGDTSKYFDMFDKLNILNINVVVVFANIEFVIPFIEKAIEKRVRKVWIASETWSLNQDLMNADGIEALGVIIGMSIQGQGTLLGLDNFIINTMHQQNDTKCPSGSQVKKTCNQVCFECLKTNPEIITHQDPTFNFAIYSAVYAVAHALHKVLECGSSSCNNSRPFLPYVLTNALKGISFTLYNETMVFDESGNPPARYTIVYWDWNSRNFVKIGSYYTDPEVHFILNEELINWQGNKSAPVLRCSKDCDAGYRRVQTAFHSCCFDCEICIAGTYINSSADPYTCLPCKEDEWSQNASTSCNKCFLQYLYETELLSVGLMFSASFIIGTSVAIAVLFAYNYNTPVVRSAGGKMCFFLLSCLALSSTCVFFFIGRPEHIDCIMRNPAFAVFYSACLSCLAVRSFQIVCVFKMATNLPKAYEFWVKHNGQWLIIVLFVVVQLFLCTLWIAVDGPKPVQTKVQTQIMFDCTLGNSAIFYLIIIFLGLLSVACFSFAYMGTDLPENYNEGKSITFSLLIFYISWAVFLTVRLSSSEKTTAAVNAISILCSLYGILYGYFFPKSYIIIFKPENNTTAYFQTSIQSYTLHTSSM
ncbi:taste receptor type 1 member 1-like [Scleropages formosus]|uniref:taste receptor type 1 member 1-like n=1 Tax=Scleropages formosus TaxID=113540 RepID=UPI0010FAB0E7|nr:taste receptor type 1 member 1-like [Scleropages formosus]